MKGSFLRGPKKLETSETCGSLGIPVDSSEASGLRFSLRQGLELKSLWYSGILHVFVDASLSISGLWGQFEFREDEFPKALCRAREALKHGAGLHLRRPDARFFRADKGFVNVFFRLDAPF